jgi:CBS domain-containing protein
MKCRQVITPPHPSTCTPQATSQAAALIMSEEDVAIVPVVAGKPDAVQRVSRHRGVYVG